MAVVETFPNHSTNMSINYFLVSIGKRRIGKGFTSESYLSFSCVGELPGRNIRTLSVSVTL